MTELSPVVNGLHLFTLHPAHRYALYKCTLSAILGTQARKYFTAALGLNSRNLPSVYGTRGSLQDLRIFPVFFISPLGWYVSSIPLSCVLPKFVWRIKGTICGGIDLPSVDHGDIAFRGFQPHLETLRLFTLIP